LGLLLRAVGLMAALVLALGALAEGNVDPVSDEDAARVQAMEERLEELEAERAMDIRLNRSELENLDLEEGPIHVTGHKSPDSDTVCCAILYARLLTALGYDARPCMLGPASSEVRYILEQAGVDEPEILVDASGLNMVLVDHSEYAQSADGLEDAHIVGIIAHHGDGDVTTGNQMVYDARPLGSTATIIWIRYRNYGVEVDAQAATLMVGAILSDTSGLKSPTTTNADREAVAYLSPIAGIEDVDAFFAGLYERSMAYDGMTDVEIFESDVKDYHCGGIRYSIGCVNVYDEDRARDMARRMAAILPDMPAARGVDMAFAKITFSNEDIYVDYLVPSDEAAAETLLEAFPDQLVYDGTAYILTPSGSRKQVMVPALTAVLENHPRE